MERYAPIPRFDPSAITKLAAGGLTEFLLRTQGRSPWVSRLSRWTGRQIHALTGWLPGLSRKSQAGRELVLKQFRAGVPGAKLNLQAAEKALAIARKKGITGRPIEKLKRDVNLAKRSLEWTKMTGGTLPGMVRSLARNPYGTLKSGWQSMDRLGKALTGLFVLKSVKDVAQTPEEMYGTDEMPYRNRLEHIGREVGGNIGFLATGPLGMVPMITASFLGEEIGSIPGRLRPDRREYA